MFNIGQDVYIWLGTKDMSHHGVCHLDGLEIIESYKVLSVQALDQTVGDLDGQHLTGHGRLDVGEVPAVQGQLSQSIVVNQKKIALEN